ncbi:MAG TPA: tetratricopeptide repeat protein [Polyangiaceae bacterium]
MNELLPLRSSSHDEWELAVLGSAGSDAPPDGARSRVALALGVGATLVASSTAVAVGGAGVALAGSTGTAASSASASAVGLATGAAAAATGAAGVSTGAVAVSGLATWAGVGLVAGLVTSVAGHSLTRPAPNEALARPPAPMVSPARPVASSRPERERPPRAPLLAPVPELPTSDALLTQPALSKPRVSEPPGESLLAQEVAALDEARHALDTGESRAALAALDRYRARFAGGALAREAAVLRVKALLSAGDRAGAEREADGILRAAPGSRYAERVRGLLGRTERR